MPSSSANVALITGANKGIGFEVARQIGRTGATVLLGARDREAGETAAAVLAGEGLAARHIALDVTSPASIAAAAADIEACFGRLDVLVNNAGINDPQDGLPSVAGLEAVERVFRTNFLGALAVTQAMLPLLSQGPFGPDRQCFERAWFAGAKWRPGLSIGRRQTDRLQCCQGCAEHAQRAACLRAAQHCN